MSTMTMHPSLPRPSALPRRGSAPRPAWEQCPARRKPSSGPPGRAEPIRAARLRLTQRGRLLVLVTWLGLALAVGFGLAAGSAADLDAGAPPPAKVVVVGSGDTLWGIAASAVSASGEEDVRGMVHRIQELNGLESGLLQAGQQLRVPLN